MIALILILNQAVSYFWVSNYIIRPQIDQTMYLLASEVRLVQQRISETATQRDVAALDSDFRHARGYEFRWHRWETRW